MTHFGNPGSRAPQTPAEGIIKNRHEDKGQQEIGSGYADKGKKGKNIIEK
jgi:hypothetical protein